MDLHIIDHDEMPKREENSQSPAICDGIKREEPHEGMQRWSSALTLLPDDTSNGSIQSSRHQVRRIAFGQDYLYGLI